MTLRIFCLFFCLYWATLPALSAQNSAKRISVGYAKAPLKRVLDDLSNTYDIRFAYSPEYIPLQQPVTLSVSNATLNETLDKLFEPLPVAYRFIGGQVVLRPSQKEIPRISIKVAPKEVQQQSPLYVDPRMEQMLAERRRLWQQQMPSIQHRETGLATEQNHNAENLRIYQLTPNTDTIETTGIASTSEGFGLEPINDTIQTITRYLADSSEATLDRPVNQAVKTASSRLAQISLLPFLGTNAFKSNRTTNKVSVNLLWGTNGGVEGLEVGGIGNNIRNDVKGVQVAGLVNTVGDDLIGTQLSGMMNVVSDTLQGLQAAGLFNVAGQGFAIQAAGLFNVAAHDFNGIQGASLFNYAGSRSRTIQGAGLFNVSGGETPLQAASLFNVARDVKIGQVSALFNVARRVKGIQIALINVADTVSGVSFGLLNFVAKGYNKVDLYWGESIYGNLSIKIGVKRFYNIFYFGGRTDKNSTTNSKDLTWGLGYGAGTALRLGKRTLLNFEALGIKINEKEEWTYGLHLLGQFRLLYDFRIGRSTSLFFGPTANVLFSKRLDPETQILGKSILVPEHTLLDRTINGVRQQGWIGFNAGIRF
jgi:hypothetical protein